MAVADRFMATVLVPAGPARSLHDVAGEEPDRLLGREFHIGRQLLQVLAYDPAGGRVRVRASATKAWVPLEWLETACACGLAED